MQNITNFNPRPPRGGRLPKTYTEYLNLIFQSTPSARRATIALLASLHCSTYFNPRPPRGGRLHTSFFSHFNKKISIHALREEGDGGHGLNRQGQHNFNPRPPRGGRQCLLATLLLPALFQSTPSARRATNKIEGVNSTRKISIHALREEGDGLGLRGGNDLWIFQSTPSARRATKGHGRGNRGYGISIHALREEGDG